jgi:predicted dehydrogenase
VTLSARIYGAGSIGNHLAHAARTLGWAVTVCDVDSEALRRMREEIYPARYGAWDDEIGLFNTVDRPGDAVDVVLVGTPPEGHVPIALAELERSPRAVVLEKPACPPSLEGAQDLAEQAAARGTRVFVGYNHVVSRATREAERLLAAGAVGDVQTIDVDWREHWSGIFAAHPWLDGPADSYLGSWQKGGGAAGEHSHGINLWQHFAHLTGAGRVTEVDAAMSYERAGDFEFDRFSTFNLRTESGLVGRVTQDVVGVPARKVLHLQGSEGRISWIANYDAEGDAVVSALPGREEQVIRIPKTRPDDFIEELRHVQDQLADANSAASPIRLERGLDTMLVIAAGHRAARTGRRHAIRYETGFTTGALVPHP